MSVPPNEPEAADQSQPAAETTTGPAPLEPPTPKAPQYAPPPQFTAPRQGYAPPPQYVPPQSVQPPQPQSPPPYASPQPQAQPYAPGQYAPGQYAPGQHPQGSYPAPQPGQYQPQPGYAAVVLPPPGPGGYFDGAMHPGELNRPLYGANIGQAFTRFFKNYVNFQGRASRSEYWWMMLVYAIVWTLFGIIAGIVSGATYSLSYSANDAAGAFIGLLAVVIYLGSFLPWIALHWRRLHDANLAGPLWFIMLFPYLGWIPVLIFAIMPPKPEGRRFDPPQR